MEPGKTDHLRGSNHFSTHYMTEMVRGRARCCRSISWQSKSGHAGPFLDVFKEAWPGGKCILSAFISCTALYKFALLMCLMCTLRTPIAMPFGFAFGSQLTDMGSNPFWTYPVHTVTTGLNPFSSDITDGQIRVPVERVLNDANLWSGP